MISEDKKQNKPKTPQPGSRVEGQSAGNISKAANPPTRRVESSTGQAGKSNRKQTSGKQGHAKSLHHYQTQRSSKGSTALYIMVVAACILLVGSYTVYKSSATKRPWSPAPETGELIEQTPAAVVQAPPVVVEPTTQVRPVPPPRHVARPLIHPNAVIDVSDVGLRNVPDIAAKPAFGGFKRGEPVEIVKKESGKGPAWVRIKTKSGKVGWVFASLVRERKGG